MKPVNIRTGAKETRWFVRALVGTAFLAVGGAAHEWLSPSAPPFKGRLSWFTELVFTTAGSTGLILLWMLLALGLALTARFVWRHTAKLPSDSWLW
jgi:hypothetical protein